MNTLRGPIVLQAHPHNTLTNAIRWPNTSLLPTQLLDKATHNVLKNHTIAYPAMCYGPDPGDPRLRKNVAQWLTNFYQPADAVAEDRVCITGGASQNLACLLQVYTDPAFTRNVWIVAPAYMLSFRIFEDAGFHKKLRAVPEDDEGIDIEYLRQQIKKSEDRAKAEGNDEPVSRVDEARHSFLRPHVKLRVRALGRDHPEQQSFIHHQIMYHRPVHLQSPESRSDGDHDELKMLRPYCRSMLLAGREDET